METLNVLKIQIQIQRLVSKERIKYKTQKDHDLSGKPFYFCIPTTSTYYTIQQPPETFSQKVTQHRHLTELRSSTRENSKIAQPRHICHKNLRNYKFWFFLFCLNVIWIYIIRELPQLKKCYKMYYINSIIVIYLIHNLYKIIKYIKNERRNYLIFIQIIFWIVNNSYIFSSCNNNNNFIFYVGLKKK